MPAGTTGTLKWGKFLKDWPYTPPGTHAAVELEDSTIVYVPIAYLNGPLGESLCW